MPTGIGFHTTLKACFLSGDSCPSHYHLHMSATQEILYDPARILSAEERLSTQSFVEIEQAMDGYSIFIFPKVQSLIIYIFSWSEND